MTIIPNVTHKKKETKSNLSKNAPKNPNKNDTFPSAAVNSVTDKIFLWLGVDHNRQGDTRNYIHCQNAR